MSASLRSCRAVDVAQRQRDGDRGVAGLPLRVRVRLAPGSEAGRRLHAVGRRPRLQRPLGEPLRLFDVLPPARIVGQLGPLFEHQAPELVDAELLDQELDARRGAVLLLAKAGIDARDRLRQRQQLLRRHEAVEQLGLEGHAAKPAADVQLEAALDGAVVTGALRGDGAHVVQHHQPARLVLAAGEGDLELPPEVLHVGMAQQELRAGRWRRG